MPCKHTTFTIIKSTDYYAQIKAVLDADIEEGRDPWVTAGGTSDLTVYAGNPDDPSQRFYFYKTYDSYNKIDFLSVRLSNDHGSTSPGRMAVDSRRTDPLEVHMLYDYEKRFIFLYHYETMQYRTTIADNQAIICCNLNPTPGDESAIYSLCSGTSGDNENARMFVAYEYNTTPRSGGVIANYAGGIANGIHHFMDNDYIYQVNNNVMDPYAFHEPLVKAEYMQDGKKLLMNFPIFVKRNDFNTNYIGEIPYCRRVNGKNLAVGDKVNYNGKVYQCFRDNGYFWLIEIYPEVV